MSKHSAGPWSIGTPPPNGEQTIGTAQGLMVAVATTGASVQTKANARLIAAAPDLLDELLSVLDWAVTERAPLREQEIESIRKVIAKATGEHP